MTSTATTGQQIEDQYKLVHWGIDFTNIPTWERALYRAAYAADVLHVVEGSAYDLSTGEFTAGPPYNNVGPDVNRYLESVGTPPGNPWCAAFGSCMLLDSGVARHDLPEGAASVHEWQAWAKANGKELDQPTRGCFGLIIESPTAGHLVIVSAVSDGYVSTIEGNTNTDGSRDGYGVFRRQRPISEIATWVDTAGF